MEPWRVFRLVVADSYSFNAEQDRDPYYSEKKDPGDLNEKLEADPKP
jgi:hypothetical protein